MKKLLFTLAILVLMFTSACVDISPDEQPPSGECDACTADEQCIAGECIEVGEEVINEGGVEGDGEIVGEEVTDEEAVDEEVIDKGEAEEDRVVEEEKIEEDKEEAPSISIQLNLEHKRMHVGDSIFTEGRQKYKGQDFEITLDSITTTDSKYLIYFTLYDANGLAIDTEYVEPENELIFHDENGNEITLNTYIRVLGVSPFD